MDIEEKNNEIMERTLCEIIGKIKNGDITSKMSKMLTDLFLLHMYEREIKDPIGPSDSPSNVIDEELAMKYYIMGWHVYKMIDDKK